MYLIKNSEKLQNLEFWGNTSGRFHAWLYVTGHSNGSLRSLHKITFRASSQDIYKIQTNV